MNPGPDPATVRRRFAEAAAFFLDAVLGVGDEQWEAPGLGEWTVRELTGHTLRALLTVEQYLQAPPVEVTIHSPAAYYRASLASPRIHAAVAERGREAGATLTEPAAAVARVVARVVGMVDAAGDDVVVATPAGGMRLMDYLPTRAVELVVHTLDLLRATGQDWAVASDVFALPLATLVDLANPSQLLLALTGREPLPSGYNVLA